MMKASRYAERRGNRDPDGGGKKVMVAAKKTPAKKRTNPAEKVPLGSGGAERAREAIKKRRKMLQDI